MGNCWSSDYGGLAEEKERSAQIDREIERERKTLRNECKLLLLGSGESGKSTIIKQMKIIHQNGFTTAELKAYRPAIYRNVVDAAINLIDGLDQLGLRLYDPLNGVHVERLRALRNVCVLEPDDVPAALAAAEAVYGDRAMNGLLDRRSEFYLMDSGVYFLDAVKRLSRRNYVPTVDDVLRARVKTTGIHETHFSMGQLHINMLDIGGQRSERKKWIHCFEGVTSILFCVALSEYDQALIEDDSQNRMAESLVLFDSIVNSKWFQRSSLILFLNKIDIFQEKIHRVPLEDYFPAYVGGPDLANATKFMLWNYTERNRSGLTIYPHLTQATNTSNIRVVFTAVRETIVQNTLRDSGMV
ncbi:guanine nucleotide-binding protein alpha-3 subunit [Dipodascopsis tothii]|uniref:guanine nucleotide-binding protein alpha-3 subunit n=1 Tax=Dipodascopsis tothii TaxID=44089 RepID=UPI0034D00241